MPFFCRAGIETRICCESAWLGQSMAETHFHCYALPLCVSQPPLRVQVHILFVDTTCALFFIVEYQKKFEAYVTILSYFLAWHDGNRFEKKSIIFNHSISREKSSVMRAILHRVDFRFRWYQFVRARMLRYFSREIEASKSQTKIKAIGDRKLCCKLVFSFNIMFCEVCSPQIQNQWFMTYF